jgi:hypothetical protein
MKSTASKEQQTMTAAEMIQQAEQLEADADTLYMSLLAPSMTERTIREEAAALREQAREVEQLATMTGRELVAYWNILQFPAIGDSAKTARHTAIVSELLTERGIAHRAGARTIAA